MGTCNSFLTGNQAGDGGEEIKCSATLSALFLFSALTFHLLCVCDVGREEKESMWGLNLGPHIGKVGILLSHILGPFAYLFLKKNVMGSER